MAQANSRNIGGRTSSELQVRRAKQSDLPALQQLYDQLHLKNYMKLRVAPAKLRLAFARLAKNRDHTILVAQLDGRVVGTCHVIIVPHLGHALQPFAVVENVVVDATARSLGVGQRLMEAATELARRRGCYKMALTTNIVRRRAHRFYERLGWTRTHFGYSIGLK